MNFEFWSYIPSVSQNLFLASLLFFILTCFLFFTNRKRFLIPFGISALLMGCAFAMAIPYFYIWDEQFHALVGKNLSLNPFHPKLIDMTPSLIRARDWSESYTWLHKQPLFLYQIALSIKLFGSNVFAVRLPSVLLHAAGVLAIFDMGKMVFNKNLGFLSATLFLFAFYPLGLLSGRIGTDHNDSVFMIYVLLSFWAYFRYMKSKSKKWRNWIGVFAGLAILTKWFVGLLVFAPWGIFALFALKNRNKTDLSNLVKALGIALLIALPWQIYIHLYFPEEATYELAYNARHFFEALEGHRGSFFFHFENVEFTLFSPWILSMLLILSIVMARINSGANKYYWSLWIASVALFLFFSLSKTKMVSFIIPALPLIFLICSFGIIQLLEYIPKHRLKKMVLVITIFIFVPIVFKAQQSIDDFGFDPEGKNFGNHSLYLEQTKFIVKNRSDDSKTVILNAYLRGHGNIQWMFFSKNKALAYVPSERRIKQMKQEGYKIKCIQWNDTLPNYITKDSTIELLSF